MSEKETFEFVYSAPDQTEVKKIREKYLPRKLTKMDQLRALDKSVTKRGNAVSIVHGALYSLVLGFGMSCCMVWSATMFVPGIVIGCIGLAGVSMTYPIYHRIVRKEREKIAPEILRLSNDLILGNE